MELVDLRFSGPKFTWRGTQNGNLVQERLDCGMVNGEWQSRWLNTSVFDDNARASDHCLFIINTELESEMWQRMGGTVAKEVAHHEKTTHKVELRQIQSREEQDKNAELPSRGPPIKLGGEQ